MFSEKMLNPGYFGGLWPLGFLMCGFSCVWYIVRRYLVRSGDEGAKREVGIGKKESFSTIASVSEDARPAPLPEVNIYFGSQTGTAESFARQVKTDLIEQAGYDEEHVSVTDLEEFDPLDFVEEKWVIFLVATYGEGEPTDNAVDAYRWLNHKQRADLNLPELNFAVFGLGNRQYSQFNAIGRKTRALLLKFGCTEIADYGEGDDDQDIEQDFQLWKAAFIQKFKATIGAATTPPNDSALHLPPTLKLATISASKVKALKGVDPGQKGEIENKINKIHCNTKSHKKMPQGTNLISKNLYNNKRLPLLNMTQMRNDQHKFQSTVHLELKTPSDFYTTASTLYIQPQNNIQQTVKFFLDLFNINYDKQYDSETLNISDLLFFEENSAHKYPFPTPCTVAKVMFEFCDLTETPCKNTLKILSHFLTDEGEKASFLKLISDEYSQIFKQFVKNSCLNFAEFVRIFMKSFKIDFYQFIQYIPNQKARPYTIASSSLENETQIDLAISLVAEQNLPPLPYNLLKKRDLVFSPLSDQNNTARHFKGLCSNYVCGLQNRGGGVCLNDLLVGAEIEQTKNAEENMEEKKTTVKNMAENQENKNVENDPKYDKCVNIDMGDWIDMGENQQILDSLCYTSGRAEKNESKNYEQKNPKKHNKLSNLVYNDFSRLYCHVRHSGLKLPSDPFAPIIMISTGTGIAPFRAFLREMGVLYGDINRTYKVCEKLERKGEEEDKHDRKSETNDEKSDNNDEKLDKNDEKSKKKNSTKKQKPHVMFVFGCTHQDNDFLYKEEILQAQKDGIIDELLLAFSRQNPEKKVYVQHKLEEAQHSVADLLFKKNAHVYICGSIRMSQGVQHSLQKIADAQKFSLPILTHLRDTHRYHEEVWS